MDLRAPLPVGSTVFLIAPVWLNGQGVEFYGGPEVPVKSVVHWLSQGQSLGRCSVTRRPEDEILPARLISFRRMVPVVALARVLPVRVAAARVRLKAMIARTSQAAFAVKLPEGKYARAEFFKSAWTCSMIACPRWVLSAVTISRELVVKNAWNRCVSKRVPWPSPAFLFS